MIVEAFTHFVVNYFKHSRRRKKKKKKKKKKKNCKLIIGEQVNLPT